MAVGASTISAVGGAASDLFAGFGAATSANLKAQGLDIEAEGTQLSAEGQRLKAGGDLAEASEYDLAAQLAQKNADYTKMSTAISTQQLDRQNMLTIGSERAAAGAGGIAASGSALDVLRDSAQQGAIARNVLQMQGQITEEGFEEQRDSYTTMANAGRATAAGEEDIAAKTDVIATQQQKLASDTEAAGKQAETFDFISAALKGAAAVAGVVAAIPTGGTSLVATAGALGAMNNGPA